MVKKTKYILILVLLIILPTTSLGQNTIIDEVTNVSAGYRTWYYFNSNVDNLEFVLDIRVTQGNDISFFVTNEDNHQKAIDGQQFQYYAGRYDIVSVSLKVTIGPADRYYIILDNADSFTSTTVDIKAEVVQIVEENEESGDGGFIFLILIIGSLLFTGYFLLKNNKNNNQYHSPPPRQMNNTYSQRNFCGSCGSEQSMRSNFCQNCGRSLK